MAEEVRPNYISLIIILLSTIDEREPMLYVDVNLGAAGSQRIVVYQGDQAEVLAENFAHMHNLDSQMRDKLTVMLQQQISGVLDKIDEEQATSSNNSGIE